MNPQPLLVPADALVDPVLLVSTTGEVLQVNRAAIDEFALPSGAPGKHLAELVVDDPAKVTEYLRRCSRSRQPVPGSFTFRANGRPTQYRSDGALIAPAGGGSSAVICLQCRLNAKSNLSFVALNEKIEQLAREVTMRRRAEARLQFLLEQQEVLTQELHHRVKNNLQVIGSLINLQAANAPDPQMRANYRELADRVRAMGFIQKQLYDRHDVSAVNIGSFLSDLCASLETSYGRKNVRIEIITEDIDLSLDSAVPLGLIVNELVSNALKHAFDDHTPGRVTVTLSCTGERSFRLCVADNGRGLPGDHATPKRGSLGLHIVNSLAGQIGGKIQIDSTPETTFSISFSDAKRPIRMA